MRAPARVFGILAKEANTVVLLRRGPSRHTLMLTWDLKTDKITPGQWLKGRVHELNCDVSPDGKYLVALCSNYSEAHRKRHPDQEIPWTWTVICRPPYFTALTLWTGPLIHELAGGVWTSNHHLRMAASSELAAPEKPIPGWLTVVPWIGWWVAEVPLYEKIMANKGWQVISKQMERPLAMTWKSQTKWCRKRGRTPIIRCDGVILRVWKRGTICRVDEGCRLRWELWDRKGRVVRTWISENPASFWMEVDKAGRVVFAENGCLYRWTSFPDGEPTLVADLNNYTFTEVPPPSSATRW